MMFYVLGNYLFFVSLFSEERYEYAKKLKNTIQELQKVNKYELSRIPKVNKYELSRITKGKSLKCKYELWGITKGKSLKCKYELSRITKGKSLKCKYELWGWFTPYKQCKLQVSCRWHNVLKMPVLAHLSTRYWSVLIRHCPFVVCQQLLLKLTGQIPSN